MRTVTRSITVVLVAALCLLTLSGCIVKSGRGEQIRMNASAVDCPVAPDTSVTTTARLGYQEIPNGDLVVKATSLLEKCLPNARITWSKFASGGDVVQAFGSGSLDLGLLGSAPASRALSAPLNIDMKVVWIYDVIGAAESLVVKDPAIKDIQGLRGKKIAVPFATTSHYSLLAALNRAGMAGSVSLIDLKPDAMVGAWRSEVDAAWIWEPTLSELTKTGHIIETSAETAKQGAPTFDLAGARGDFVQRNAAFMKMWTLVQSWAVDLLNEKATTASALISAQLGVPPDEIAGQLKGYQFVNAKTQAGQQYLGGQLGLDIAKTAAFQRDQGEVSAVNPERVYVDAVYPAAAAEVGK